MAAKATKVEGVIAKVLTGARVSAAGQLDSWRKPEQDIRRLVRSDYVRSLRHNLDYRMIRELVKAFAAVEPDFNHQPIAMGSLDRFAQVATDLRFHFKASPYGGDEGLALRGFYVTRGQGMLKRPLIYVNTAHHPLAVSATFCHEFGHHLSAELFGLGDEPVHFFFDADYASHLKEPSELAADVLVSFAGYPESIARRIFATPWNWGLVARAKNLTEAALNEVRAHLRSAYGFDLMERIPANQRLHYLSGMIHYAKLRWALLAEYDL
ncbi:MAG: hypothetical protein ACREQN_00105 [Candidatus Binataceae bacterium]